MDPCSAPPNVPCSPGPVQLIVSGVLPVVFLDGHHPDLDVKSWLQSILVAQVLRAACVESDRPRAIGRPRWSRVNPKRGRVCRGGRRYAGGARALCPDLLRGGCARTGA